MEALECNMLQVGSSDSLDIVTSRENIVSDLKELADLLAERGFYLAYENWCWSTHAPDWKAVWEIVEAVGRPNIGLCLDTFQSAGGEWADPTTASGIIETSASREELEERFSLSLQELSETIPKDKIYILQISDAYQVRLDDRVDAQGLRPRGQWSSKYRPPPFQGGYLPVADVAKAVLKTGFRGWFSMEVFDGGPQGDAGSWNNLPAYTQQAMQAHKQLLAACADH